MTLEARTQPYCEEIESNCSQILKLAQWIMDNPNARDDLRREKFAAMRKLERENEIIEAMWDESRDTWLRTRLNSPASVSALAPDVLRHARSES